MSESYVFDRAGTVRLHDEDTGRLHVAETPISKAGINEYYGREIPGAAKLGLDGGKKYRILRPPEELERAAQTFNRVPVLTRHSDKPFAAHEHKSYKHQVGGTTGSATRYDHPYLKTDMSVWDKSDIDGIAQDSARELSACYFFTIDMTPGSYDGQDYDGRMTNIRGHHVALVPVGRAGRDVHVADAQADDGKITKKAAKDAQIGEKKVSDVTTEDVQAAIDAAVAKVEAKYEAKLAAMDAARDEAVKAAKDEATADAVKRMRDQVQAEKDVRPLVGEVVGMDSAEDVYAHALRQKGVDIEGVHPSAYKALVKMAAEKAAVPVIKPAAAMDAAADKSYQERFKMPYLVQTGV